MEQMKLESLDNSKEPKQCCSVRTVLWFLVFTGMAVNYMIRINLNIAIVSMIVPKSTAGSKSTGVCSAGQVKQIITEETKNQTVNLTVSMTEEPQHLIEEDKKLLMSLVSNKFDWNEKEQGNILGSFFWLHWLTQIPGGILAAKYGTKKVYGLANFLGSLCCFVIPYSAYQSVFHLILLRVAQGLVCGFCWPAVHDLTAKWIPPNQRSKFVTAYMGSSVGAALTYPVCGFVIDQWGWELVFYLSGVIGTLWFIVWWIFVYDSPTQHPRISTEEKNYILNCLGQQVNEEKVPVPWMKILTCTSVWMNVLAQFGGVYGFFTLMTHGPTYFNFIHGWNIKATGFFSGMPHLIRMVFAVLSSQLGDYLLSTEKMSRSGVRKFATIICCIVQGCFMVGLSFSGCNRTAAIIFLTLAVASHGAVTTGPLASVVDISPNYASVILGVINTIVAVVGFLTPVVVGYLTFNNQTIDQWQKVFWIACCFLFSSGLVYLLFAKSELHSWNSPNNERSVEEAGMMLQERERRQQAIVIFGSELEI